MAITIYPAEEEAGLGELLRKPLCAAWDAPVRLRVHRARADADKPTPDRRGRAVATNLGQEDLFYLDNVLVTAGYEIDADRGVPVGWNKNDQIFDTLEVWAARHSPEDKPFNYGHDCADIIGHTTACFAETLTGERIPDDATTLPGAFNIVSSDVLYRVWQDAALQERMDGVLANLTGDEPSWFVSMECLYADFDYALLDKTKKLQIVARNAETAFLSKYLRTAKGSGTYDGKRVGMVLRNLIFSGKGLVENPANPKSVVRTVAEAETSTLPSTEPAEKTREKSRVSAAGYIPAPQTEPLMDETQALKTDKARLEAENAQLRVKLAEAETAKLAEAKLAQAKAEQELAAANQARTELEKAKAEAEKSHAAASEQIKAEFDKVVAEKTALASELAEAKAAQAKAVAEQKKAERTGRVVASLGLEPTDAEKVAEPLAGLDDAAFAAHLEILSKGRAGASAPNETKVVGSPTSFPGGAPSTPPTALNVGTPPTALPAGKPGTAFANDAAGVLDRATPETTPALGAAAAAPDPKVEDLRMAFAKQLGYQEPDADDDSDDSDDDAA